MEANLGRSHGTKVISLQGSSSSSGEFISIVLFSAHVELQFRNFGKREVLDFTLDDLTELSSDVSLTSHYI